VFTREHRSGGSAKRRSVIRKQQCLVVPSTVQDVDDFDEARSDPVEDQIVRVDTPADAVAFKAWNERVAERQLTKGLAVIQQFMDKACGAPGIVRPDVVSNSDEVALRRSRNDDFRTGAQAFPEKRSRSSVRTSSIF
jgi:hypothetical protein